MIITKGECRELTAEEKLKIFIESKHKMSTDELITLLFSELGYYMGKCEMYERQISTQEEADLCGVQLWHDD